MQVIASKWGVNKEEKRKPTSISAKVEIPLIHTLLKFNLAQYIVGCQGGGVEAGSTALMAIDVKGVAYELRIPTLL